MDSLVNADSNLGDYIANNFLQFSITALVGLVVGALLLLVFCYFSKKMIGSIEDIVMVFAFFVALMCFFASVLFKETNISINLLSLFCSFIFSWLLTKKSSKGEFKEQQEAIAKTTYRHIGDIKSAALVTQDRLLILRKKEGINQTDIDGILDNVKIILKGIKTNEEDWKDMLSNEYIEELSKNEDPENELDEQRENIEQPTSEDINEMFRQIFGDK